ncbi:MAG: hypothetical protein GTN76_07350, partial [Candidatus Aenigmarchaeota archaeon]|nr:hypothetical protein [Candidatus Aenigmarchaeota archaeon]
ENYGISFSGFRFPYLRWDEKCINALAKYNFKWDSSFTVLWDVLESKLSSEKNLMSYQNMLGQYKYQRSCDCISLPKFQNDILEIPVSLPDDELLKDRLGIKDRKILSQIWDDILKQTYERGELFTLQLHPERITIFFEALESVIQRARTFQPSVWIASLTDIADWWLEKGNSSFHIEIKNAREFKCNVQCSER